VGSLTEKMLVKVTPHVVPLTGYSALGSRRLESVILLQWDWPETQLVL